MRQSKLIAVLCVLAAAVAGCTKEKRDAIIGGNSAPTGPATLSSLQTDVFRLSCATSGCHDNRANPAANLDLSTAQQTYLSLVNRQSTEATQMKLVVPGDPNTSYLMNKLLGTHANVGGSGVRMPQYAAPLSQEETDRITAWISGGASAN